MQALTNDKMPEIIFCAHKGFVVNMAHGYRKVTGKPMAALVRNVVGLLNGTNGIYNAWLDEATILVIGGTGPVDIEKSTVRLVRTCIPSLKTCQGIPITEMNCS